MSPILVLITQPESFADSTPKPGGRLVLLLANVEGHAWTAWCLAPPIFIVHQFIRNCVTEIFRREARGFVNANVLGVGSHTAALLCSLRSVGSL